MALSDLHRASVPRDHFCNQCQSQAEPRREPLNASPREPPEDFCSLTLGNPRSTVFDFEHGQGAFGAQAHTERGTLRGELEGIGNEVLNDSLKEGFVS